MPSLRGFGCSMVCFVGGWSWPCFSCAKTTVGRLTRTSVHHHYQLKTKLNLGTRKRKRKWEHGSRNTEAKAEVASTRKGLADQGTGRLVLATNGVNRFGSFWDRPPSGGLSASRQIPVSSRAEDPRVPLASTEFLVVLQVAAVEPQRP